MRSLRLLAPWLPWALSVALGLLLVASACRDIGNFIEDDSLISLRYSERLLEGKGLTWTDGERVEGYSNLSQVLLVAAIGATGLDLIDALRVFTVGSLVLAFIATMLFARRVGAGWAGTTLALVLLGSTASISIWAVAGLEQPFVLACLSTALWCLAELHASDFHASRWAWRGGGSLAFLVWTRPDSPLFVALLAGGLFLLAGRRNLWALPRMLVAIVGVPLGAWLAQLSFRLAYYGEWVPNTAYVKAHVTEARLREGVEYVRLGLETNALFSGAMAVALVLALLNRAMRRWALVLATLAAPWTVYVAAVGGDHFPGWRHLVPVWGLGALLVALAFAALGRRRLTAWARPVIALAVVPALGWSHEHQWARRENHVVRFTRWQWEGQAIGELFGEAFARERPLYAVTAAGCLPYFSKLPALDMLGLNDKHIARQPAQPRMPLGHDHGDGQYVLKRAPDLITFGMPRGDAPAYVTGEEMTVDPAFGRDYARLPFQALEPLVMTSQSYVRLAGRVGVQRTGDEVRVPAYLLQPSRGMPTPDGGMGALLFKGEVARWTLPSLEPGRWRVELVPPNPHVAMRVAPQHQRDAPVVQFAGIEVSLRRAVPVEVSVLAPDVHTVVGALVLKRLPEDAPPAAGTFQGSMKERFAAVGLGPPSLRPESKAERDTSSTPLGRTGVAAGQDFGPWKVTGAAFGSSPVKQARPGQTPVTGTTGPFFNSFLGDRPGASGDAFRGTLTSPEFTARSTSVLHFRVGGGRAEGFDTQVGVRLVEVLPAGQRAVRFVVTGERDEELRPISLDLGWLAGRRLFVEVFDDAVGGWGHVLASDFVLTE